MATGNLKVKKSFCKGCNKNTKVERNGIIWGLGDFILVLFSAGLWALLRIMLNAIVNPWRCSECGTRAWYPASDCDVKTRNSCELTTHNSTVGCFSPWHCCVCRLISGRLRVTNSLIAIRFLLFARVGLGCNMPANRSHAPGTKLLGFGKPADWFCTRMPAGTVLAPGSRWFTRTTRVPPSASMGRL